VARTLERARIALRRAQQERHLRPRIDKADGGVAEKTVVPELLAMIAREDGDEVVAAGGDEAREQLRRQMVDIADAVLVTIDERAPHLRVTHLAGDEVVVFGQRRCVASKNSSMK